ncbi:SEN1 N terminal-domain-containing protein [Panaeolus papilionaceus]|nr:SEN1 N terminal-domain-containing protein [Panaeolus papilionaceus]
MPSESDVKALLHGLRTKPEGNTVKEETLGVIFTYLYSVSANAAGEYHWFCPQASQLTIEAATFSVRLFAYNSEAVSLWKKRLRQCLSGCASCVRGMESAKEESREVYMSAYETHRLDGFFATFEAWELECFLHENPSISGPSSNTSHPLSEAALHQMLWNWTILSDSRVAHYLQSTSPSRHISLTGPVPPGAFVLLFVDSAPVRQWALSVCSSSTMINFNEKDTRSTYSRVLNAIIPVSSNALIHAQGGQGTILGHYTLTTSQNVWPSFYSAIRLLPPSVLSPKNIFAIPQLVISHLGDVGIEFIAIFNCFVLLLKRLNGDIWKSSNVPSPVNVLSTLQQNPGFLASADLPDHAKSQATSLRELLATTRGDAVFCDTFSCVVKVLLDRCKHVHKQDVRGLSLTTLTHLISTAWRQSQEDQTAVAQGLKRNAEVLVPLLYTEENWSNEVSGTLSDARKVVENVLLQECQGFEKVVAGFTDALVLHSKLDKDKDKSRQKKLVDLPTFNFSSELWDQLCLIESSRDRHLFAMAIRLAGKIYHLAPLRLSIFKPLETDKAGSVTGVINRFNASLKSLHAGLGRLIASFANYSISNDALILLTFDGILESVVYMVLSPSNQLESAAKSLVGLAYDVDGRTECCRALMEHQPKETMKAMMDYLSRFYQSTVKAPEACDTSAALVRCFADILDVLCDQQDGLLHRNTFLLPSDKEGPASLLPKFWKLLAKALSAIYDRTPMWSNHVSTPEMVSWMRDALILARDIMNKWRVIESAVHPNDAQGPRKLSEVGKGMINDLQDFLPAVVKWLRLTDEELLHQSFSLLQNVLDVMKETDVRPLDTSLKKLRTFIINAQESASAKRELRTRLDSGRLLSLVKSLAQFDDDDEVEIVEAPASTKATKASKAKQVVPLPAQVKKPYILGKDARTTKPSAAVSRVTPAPAVKRSSNFFSDKDQGLLDAASSMPSFRRPSTSAQPIAGGSKPVKPAQMNVIKDESSVAPIKPEGASSSEDEPESDGETKRKMGELGLLPRKQPAKIQPQPQRRSLIVLDTDLKPIDPSDKSNRNFRNALQETRNQAMRMKPDISELHQSILSWDYNHDGPLPPGPQLSIGRVPQTFESYEHYFRTFQPLLLMECWHSLLQSKDEKQDAYTCIIDTRQYVGKWSHLEITIQGSVKKEWYLSETDVVLLTHPGNAKHCVLGKVNNYRALAAGIQATIRCLTKPGAGGPGLVEKSTWKVSKVFSLSTINREYEALVSLQYNRMCPSIMSPSLPRCRTPLQETVLEVMDLYNVNEPQATAILNAISTSSFSLIQGPPGTGKTSTICGLISRFLSTRPRAPVPILVGQTARAQHPVTQKQHKILLCAPSNAAIDELVQRLKDGYVGAKKSTTTLSIVRIGADSAISNSVREVSLDYLVDQKINSTSKPAGELGETIKAIQKELEEVRRAREKKINEKNLLTGIDNILRVEALQKEICALTIKRGKLVSQLDSNKTKRTEDYRLLDSLRRSTRREVLLEADVICSTLSGAGHESLDGLEFDMVIIDEAAQSIELSSLIPLRFECQRCVMVGDPQQLPPTVLSPKAKDLNYGQSLFVRLHESCRDAVQLLSIQYRMHPSISHLPSTLFYNKKLLDGPDMERKTAQPWHNDEQFLPYRFFNVSKGMEQSNGRSMVNEAESQIAVALYDRLRRQFSQIDFTFRVGVVSMYRAQLTIMKRSFEQRFGKDILAQVDFNTVDGFQGQEKDIIILSCVRAGPGLTSIGFLNGAIFIPDMRRMNVALTRAKSSLFILGNAATLERSDNTWRQIVQDARSRSSLIEVIDASYFAKYTSHSGTRREGAPPPKKKIKVTSDTPSSIPADLTKPNEFKHTNAKAQSLKPVTQLASHSEIKTNNETSWKQNAISSVQNAPLSNPQSGSELPTEVATAGPSTISSSTKRRAPDDHRALSGLGQSAMRPQPAHKKPKTNSMFIPKKVQKR